MVDENRIEGAARTVGGKIQEAVGDLVGDTDTRIRGKVNQAAGRAQNALGGAADEMQNLTQFVGDTVRERPVFTLGIVAAMGVLIGLLARR